MMKGFEGDFLLSTGGIFHNSRIFIRGDKSYRVEGYQSGRFLWKKDKLTMAFRVQPRGHGQGRGREDTTIEELQDIR